jgi:hypothetical protein
MLSQARNFLGQLEDSPAGVDHEAVIGAKHQLILSRVRSCVILGSQHCAAEHGMHLFQRALQHIDRLCLIGLQWLLAGNL